MESVPTELFNFLCWITGFSDDPSLESLRKPITEKQAKKIDSVAHDLVVFFSSKGRKQTPIAWSVNKTSDWLCGNDRHIEFIWPLSVV